MGLELPRVDTSLARQAIQRAVRYFPQQELVQASRVTNAPLRGKYAYVGGIADYAREVLHVEPTPDQERIWRMVQTPPYKVLARAANSVGKSYCGAVAVNHFFDTYDPCVILTTAPTFEQVKDILWKEVRLQRYRAKQFDPDFQLCFSGPKDPSMDTGVGHTAKGLTARDASSFHGKHDKAVFIVMDEAQGIAPEFWEASETMIGGEVYGFLGLYNPLDPSAQVFQEESSPGYHPVLTMSALEHPNVQRGLRGLGPIIPAAVTWPRFKDMVEKWCVPIAEQDALEDDVLIDERDIGGKKQWWRPGLAACARLFGRWSKLSEDSVWSVYALDRMSGREAVLMDDRGPLQVGCDIAWKGMDDTCMVVRKGCVCLHVEAHNGWDSTQVASRCIELAAKWGTKYGINPKIIPIAIDSTGSPGCADIVKAEGWNAIHINSSECPESLKEANQYPNVRSFLWFYVAEAASKGFVSIARLPPADQQALKAELRIPRYKMDNKGRRVVEQKQDIKKRNSNRSPDRADAFNLAFLHVPAITMGEVPTGRIPVAR